ncbi:MAG: hypothetical protein DHS20C10_08640 [marine bacterium B5-7]|nr:MAG: hypothetical protein DHS20C10_08640 [marine bacterium B5-7]
MAGSYPEDLHSLKKAIKDGQIKTVTDSIQALNLQHREIEKLACLNLKDAQGETLISTVNAIGDETTRIHMQTIIFEHYVRVICKSELNVQTEDGMSEPYFAVQLGQKVDRVLAAFNQEGLISAGTSPGLNDFIFDHLLEYPGLEYTGLTHTHLTTALKEKGAKHDREYTLDELIEILDLFAKISCLPAFDFALKRLEKMQFSATKKIQALLKNNKQSRNIFDIVRLSPIQLLKNNLFGLVTRLFQDANIDRSVRFGEYLYALRHFAVLTDQAGEILETYLGTRFTPERLLRFAVRYDNVDQSMQYLLGKIRNLDVQSREGITAMMIAVMAGNLKALEALLRRDANPDLRNGERKTVHEIAGDLPQDKKDAVLALLERHKEERAQRIARKLEQVKAVLALSFSEKCIQVFKNPEGLSADEHTEAFRQLIETAVKEKEDLLASEDMLVLLFQPVGNLNEDQDPHEIWLAYLRRKMHAGILDMIYKDIIGPADQQGDLPPVDPQKKKQVQDEAEKDGNDVAWLEPGFDILEWAMLFSADNDALTALLDSTFKGDSEDVSANRQNKITDMLGFASEKGLEKSIAFLLDAGASSQEKYCVSVAESSKADKKIFTAIELAVHCGHPAVVKALLQHASAENFQENREYPENLLTTAVALGHVGVVRVLLDANIATSYAQEAFIAAIQDGHWSMVRLFLENPKLIKLNQGQEPLGLAPIHFAAQHGHLDVVHLLLRFGANLFQQDKSGREPRECLLDKSRALQQLFNKVSPVLGEHAYIFHQMTWATNEDILLCCADMADARFLAKNNKKEYPFVCLAKRVPTDIPVATFRLVLLKTLDACFQREEKMHPVSSSRTGTSWKGCFERLTEALSMRSEVLGPNDFDDIQAMGLTNLLNLAMEHRLLIIAQVPWLLKKRQADLCNGSQKEVDEIWSNLTGEECVYGDYQCWPLKAVLSSTKSEYAKTKVYAQKTLDVLISYLEKKDEASTPSLSRSSSMVEVDLSIGAQLLLLRRLKAALDDTSVAIQLNELPVLEYMKMDGCLEDLVRASCLQENQIPDTVPASASSASLPSNVAV